MRFTDMLAGAFDRTIAFLPNILAALLIMVVGFLVAKILSSVTRRMLAAVHLERRPTAHKLVEQARLGCWPTVLRICLRTSAPPRKSETKSGAPLERRSLDPARVDCR